MEKKNVIDRQGLLLMMCIFVGLCFIALIYRVPLLYGLLIGYMIGLISDVIDYGLKDEAS